MAIYRQVHTCIWRDPWFLELPPEHKFLFIYLFTNESSSISGIYELSERIITFETGLDQSQVKRAMAQFASDGKVYYDGRVVWVTNMREYQGNSKSPKVKSRIDSDVSKIPDSEIKGMYLERYGYSIDTVSIPCYSSSFSSSSSEQPPKNSQPQFDYIPEPIQDIITALSAICRTPLAPGFNEDKYMNAAQALYGWDATPEQVNGFAAYWAKHNYYDKQGPPYLKTIIDEWQSYRNGGKPKAREPIPGVDFKVFDEVDDG